MEQGILFVRSPGALTQRLGNADIFFFLMNHESGDFLTQFSLFSPSLRKGESQRNAYELAGGLKESWIVPRQNSEH